MDTSTWRELQERARRRARAEVEQEIADVEAHAARELETALIPLRAKLDAIELYADAAVYELETVDEQPAPRGAAAKPKGKRRAASKKRPTKTGGRAEEEVWSGVAERISYRDVHLDEVVAIADELEAGKSPKQVARKIQSWTDLGLMERPTRAPGGRAVYRFTEEGCARYGIHPPDPPADNVSPIRRKTASA